MAAEMEQELALAGSNSSLDEKQVVVFNLGDEEFGVDIGEVREINRVAGITKIPNTPDSIRGIINLRGSVIVIIDLSIKLGLPPKPFNKNTRIIVIDVEGTTVGLIVDSATEVLRLNNNQIKPAPTVILRKIDANYIEGVGVLEERLLILLDLAKVLEGKELNSVMQVASQVPMPVENSEALQESKPEEPKVEEKPEEPKVEEVKEEPKVEELKVEEPKVEEPKLEEVKVEEPKVEEKPVVEAVQNKIDPTIEETSVGEVKPEEEKVEEAPQECGEENKEEGQ